MKTLIVIPAYNEEKNIGHVLRRITSMQGSYDVLVVDDGSFDQTSEFSRRYARVKVLQLPSNLGIGGARQAGFKYALQENYDAVVQLDADNQHDPAYIEPMLARLSAGYHVCIGSRFIDREGFQSSAMRRAGIVLLQKLITFLTGRTVTDPTSGFRACDRKAIALFASVYPQDYPEPESILTLLSHGLNLCELPVTMQARRSGKSSINAGASLYFMTKVSLSMLLSGRSPLLPAGAWQQMAGPLSSSRI